MLDLPRPTALACHDAGAANIIFSWVAASPDAEPRPLVAGPAAKLWQDRFGTPAPALSIDEALDGCATLLSGTGWASDLEHLARREARRRGIRSIAVIDHWANYRARFERDGEIVWPDEFWVTDEYAAALARSAFPGAAVRLKPNLYLAQQVARIAPLDDSTPNRVLYVAEPMRSDWGQGRPGEFQALDYFLKTMPSLGLGAGAQVRIRPHPSEPQDKYDAWIGRRGEPDIALDQSRDVAEAISPARWVAGCQSFGLVVALHAGRKVICTLPPWAPKCALPHEGIVRL